MFRCYRETDLRSLVTIQRLRYDVFFGELGRELKGTCHHERLVLDALDAHPATHHYCAVLEGTSEIAAAIRVTYSMSPSVEEDFGFPFKAAEHDVVGRGNRCYTGRLVIAKQFRKTKLFVQLLSFAFGHCISMGADFVLCYCETELKHYYLRIGFYQYSLESELIGLGLRTPMVLDVHDRDHLRGIGSPFEKVWVECESPTAGLRVAEKEYVG